MRFEDVVSIAYRGGAGARAQQVLDASLARRQHRMAEPLRDHCRDVERPRDGDGTIASPGTLLGLALLARIAALRRKRRGCGLPLFVSRELPAVRDSSTRAPRSAEVHHDLTAEIVPRHEQAHKGLLA
jgi:hypothetical protein